MRDRANNIIRNNWFPLLPAILAASSLFVSYHACGFTTLHVNLDTSALIGSSAGPFYLDVQLNDANGGSLSNEVALINFQFGGGGALSGPLVEGGAVGSLGSAVTLIDSALANEFTQAFTSGTNLAFDVGLTSSPVPGDTPEGVWVSIYDSSLLPLPTQAGTNFDVLIEIDLVSTNPVVNVFASDPMRSPIAGGRPLQFAAPVLSQTANCIWVLNPTHQNFPAGGGTEGLTLTGMSNCVWGAASAVTWISITSNASGTGNGSVNYQVLPNGDTNSRTGLLLIAGQSFQVTQAAAVFSFGDGIPDWWRQKYFGTSSTTNSQSCATCDADGTGQDNLTKYLAGLNPTNSTSVFQILSLNQQGTNFVITWQAGGGSTNVVQAVSGPLDPTNPFVDISQLITLPGVGDITTNYLDPNPDTNVSTRFYRLRLGP